MALFVGDSFIIVLCCAIGVLHIRFYTSFWRRWKRCLRQSEYPPLVIKAAYRVYLDLNL